MANSIPANDLPYLLLEDFSDGDSFLILDNGKLKRITRKSLYESVQENLRGQKGETGATGPEGPQGPEGPRGKEGPRGLEGPRGADGAKGADGVQGDRGWSPLIRVEKRPEGQFLYVYDWTGGQGDRPTATGYITRNGLSQTIDFQASVQGSKGDTGVQGIRGESGKNGESVYQIAVRNGYTGTEADFLKTLVGKNNYQLAVDAGFKGTLQDWLNTITHENAYELAVENGFTGTLTDWLFSLNGTDGWTPLYATVEYNDGIYLQIIDWIGGSSTKPPVGGYMGEEGFVYEISEATNFRGLRGFKAWTPVYAIEEISDSAYLKIVDWVDGEGTKPTTTGYVSSTGIVATPDTAIDIRGYEGLSAYDVATKNNFSGTEEEWLASLVGKDGIDGDKAWTPVFVLESDINGVYIKITDYTNGEGNKPIELGYLSGSGLVQTPAEATNLREPHPTIVNTTTISKHQINVITATSDLTITSDLAVGEATEALINPATFNVSFDNVTLSDGFTLTADKSNLIKVFNYDNTIRAVVLATF